MIRGTVVALALAGLLGSRVLAQTTEPTISLHVSPEHATIGDLLTVTVEITAPEGATLDLPDENADLGDAEVRSLEVRRERLDAGGVRVSLQYEAVLWEVGERTIVAPPVTWRVGEGELRELERPEATVTIASLVPEDAEELRQVHGPREIPLRPIHYAIAALPVVLMAALVGLAIAWVRRRSRAATSVEQPADILTPREEALRALEELEAQDLPAAGRIKEHYVRLSWILRRFIERRWRLPALEETTGMLGASMRASGSVPEHLGEQIVEVLRRADLAKFAKHRPQAEVATGDIARARRIVRAATPGGELEQPAESSRPVSATG